MQKPKTTHVAEYEGGQWVPFFPGQNLVRGQETRVHAIKFEDGSIWDAYNGWRERGPYGP